MLLCVCVQVLVLPGTMEKNRSRFKTGMHTLLAIQSLGTLSPHERERIAEAKV